MKTFDIPTKVKVFNGKEVDTILICYSELSVSLSILAIIMITVQAAYDFQATQAVSQAAYDFQATQAVSKFRATHKHKKLRADAKYKYEWVGSFVCSLLLFISTLRLGLGFAFPQPAYCAETPRVMLRESTNIRICEPTNIMVCISKREITGKGLPRNNEVMRARLAKHQFSNLMVELQDQGLPNVNQDEHGKLYKGEDVRAFLLDYIQLFKELLQVLAKRNLPHPNFLLKMIRFSKPASLDPVLNALILRLRLARKGVYSFPPDHEMQRVINEMEQVIPSYFELNLEKKRDVYQLVRTIEYSSKPFVEVLMYCRDEMLWQEIQLILLKLRNSPSVSRRVRRNRTRLELLNSPSVSGRGDRPMCQLWVKNKPWRKPRVKDQLLKKYELRRKFLYQYKKQQEKYFLSAFGQAAFGEELSEQSWDLMDLCIELMKNLPPTPNVVLEQISLVISDDQ